MLIAGTPRAFAQGPSPFAFHATHYEVSATLRPSDQTLTGHAKVDFVAGRAGRDLTVELHPDLAVTSVKTDKGQEIPFARDTNNALLVRVTLPAAIAIGHSVTVVFDYGGPITVDDDSPTKDVRFSWVDKTSAYLLLPARWFPLTDYPSNRYTATFKLIVPASFAVVGTGKGGVPNELPGAEPGGGKEAEYTFTCDKPAPVGTFVAGSLQLTPQEIEGYHIPVYTPPAQVKTSQAYATELAHVLSFYSDEFGTIPDPTVTIAQMPDGSLTSFAAPGLILISQRMWSAKPNTGILANMAATQWWGDAVLPASPADTWVSDGLARYSQALYQEQDEGNLGLHNALEDFAVGALTYESEAPISQAERLSAYSDSYRSVVVDKGAMVFHMLRSELSDTVFHSLLHSFYAKYAGKAASDDDLEKMAEALVPQAEAQEAKAQIPPPPSMGPPGPAPDLNLVSFFSQWLNSTGIPEFKTDYIVYRIKKGFKVVGKVTQDLETFQMPVQVRIDTEGNPEFKTINVQGTTSTFDFETFGRPKANGVVLDPNNNILKSSPRLRVRATVAKGESLATDGKYYEAIQEYQKALDIQPTNSLAHFRTGEAMFFQKNFQASANAFRSALDGDLDPKWIEVWSHIYLGKIFDATGQRDRAVNEYQRAQQLKDDTAGAQAEAAKYLQKPYSPNPPAASASGDPK